MIALSWSRLSTYIQCPRKFQSQYINKDYPDEGDNPHFIRGNRIHKQLENYINSKLKGTALPSMTAEAQRATPVIDKVLANYDTISAEMQLALDQEWRECSWFDPPHKVRYRCIIDFLAIRGDEALCIDFKTGKVRNYEDNHGQLHLTAAMVMMLHPEINRIRCTYLFVDHKQSSSLDLTREELPEQLDYFNKYHGIVNKEEDWAPTKHAYCNWCLIKDDCPLMNRPKI